MIRSTNTIDVEIKPENGLYVVYCKTWKAIQHVYNKMNLAPGGRIVAMNAVDARYMAEAIEANNLTVQLIEE